LSTHKSWIKKITRSWPVRTVSDAFLKLIVKPKLHAYRKKYPHLLIRKNTSDIAVFRSIFLFHEFKLPRNILSPQLIIDLGAYTGLSALYYSEKYPQAKIICVEPEESNFKLLKNNTNNNPNLTLIHAGVWSKDCGLVLENPTAEKWSFIFREAKLHEKIDVEAVTVHSLLDTTNFDKIDLLKIDIEGAEKQLFAENTHLWLNKVNVLVIELHDRFVEGCSDIFYAAIDKNEWTEYKSGEKVVLIRREML